MFVNGSMSNNTNSPSSSVSASEATLHLKEMLNMGFDKARKDYQSTSLPESFGNGDTSRSSNGLSETAQSEPTKVVDGDSQVLQNLIESMKSNNSQRTQQISLYGNDEVNSFSVYSQDVEIHASEQSSLSRSIPGSNKVKTNPVVNYEWEQKQYAGNLVAVHRDGILIAYVLKGKSGGIVRIINRKTTERALIKGFPGSVLDISFAHINSVVLGCVDEYGMMQIHEISEASNGKLICNLILQVHKEGRLPSNHHRLIWCPFIPEVDESASMGNSTADSINEDNGKLLVLTHDSVAEIWHVDTVTSEHGTGAIDPADIGAGYLTISHHSKPVFDASFSPDGTTLATASLDGFVKFFQVYIPDQNPPRCLHSWKPHNGRPVTSIFFLDDHKQPLDDARFWKFAITGCDNNREFKVWSCETWTCLQTLHFLEPLERPPDAPVPCIKAMLDSSANYLILSDITRKVLYVLQIYQDMEGKKAHVSSVSEFLLTQPCVSFAVLDASRRKFRRQVELDAMHLGDATTGEIDDDEDEEEVGKDINGPEVGILVKMYSVHTRTIQELVIRFKPKSSIPMPLPASIDSSLSQDGFRDNLSEMSALHYSSGSAGEKGDEISHISDSFYSSHNRSVDPSVEASNLSYQSDQSNDLVSKDSPKPVLLTPEAFVSSPTKKELPGINDSVMTNQSSMHSSFTHVSVMDDHAHGSPASSITPTSSREFPVGSGETPTSLPLPPTTPSEEQALLTPKSTTSSLPKPDHQSTPPSSEQSKGHRTFPSAPALTASPALPKPNPALISSQKSSLIGPPLATSETCGSMEDMRRPMLKSTGSSSSTSLEVSEILEGARKPGSEMMNEATTEEEEEDEELLKKDEEQDNVQDSTERRAVEAEQVEEDSESEPEAKHPSEVSEVAGQEDDLVDLQSGGTKWPEPPAVPEVDLEAQRLAAEAIHIASEMQQRGDSDEDIDVKVEEEKEDQRSAMAAAPPLDMSVLNNFQSSLSQVIDLLQCQQQEIAELRNEMNFHQQTADVITTLQAQIDSLEGALETKMAGALNQHSKTESKRLSQVLSQKDSLEKQKHDRLVTTVSQTLDRTIRNQLEKTVKEQLTNHVLPSISKSMEPFKQQLHLEMAQKLTATDALMKENISKIVHSGPTIESIGRSAGESMQGYLKTACRDMLIPNFDRSCQTMFQQISDTFQRGTTDYHRQLQQHIAAVKSAQEAGRDPLIQHLKSMSDSWRNQAASQNDLHAQLHEAAANVQLGCRNIQDQQSAMDATIQQHLSSFEDKILREVRQIINTEVTSALRDQQESLNNNIMTALRSQAATPAPMNQMSTADVQKQRTEILLLLSQGQVNEAFQQALSASNLSLVILVCETVDPSQVFNQQPCPLEQNVLLSLIQQLSADLGSHTELKHKYLQEALMNIDQSSVVVQQHLPQVIKVVTQKLSNYINSSPGSPHIRQLRILLMAAQSLTR